MPRPHCLIFERDVEGHRLHYVHHLIETLRQVGCEVSVASRADARESAEWRVHLQTIESQFRFVPGPIPRPNNLRTGWRTGTDLMNTIRNERPDRVYIPCTEYFTQAAALRCLLTGRKRFPGPPIEGHLIRGTYAYPSASMRGFVRSMVSKRLALRSPWQITHLLDPWVYDLVKRLPARTEFRIIPEPVEPLPNVSQQQARRVLGIPLDGRYAAIIGGVRANKGVEELLAAFSRARLAPDDRVLLVGRMEEPVPTLIRERYGQLHQQGRIVCVDRYVTDYELDCGFIATNVVAVTHTLLIGSSGTLVRGAHAKRPALTTDYGWAGWATRTFDLGVTCNVSDPDGLSRSLEKAFELSADFRRTEKGDRFCRFHTLANWKAHWVAGIARDCGVPLGQLQSQTSWKWAMELVDADYA